MAKEKDNPTLADKPAESEPKPETKVEVISVTTNTPVDPASDGPGTYRVTMGSGEDVRTEEVEARDRNEAWAMFCDAMKSWPSPKRVDRKIERIG